MKYLYFLAYILLISNIDGSNDLFKYFIESKQISIESKFEYLHGNLTRFRNDNCSQNSIDEFLNKNISTEISLEWPKDVDKLIELLDNNVII